MQKGSGKDLVFLHGYGANKESFASEIDYFSKDYRVTALDFPGFQEPLKNAWDVSDYASWLKDFLADRGIKKPLVIAHSFGGRVAIKANCFERMLLVGCAGVRLHRFRTKIKVLSYKAIKRINPTKAGKMESEEYASLTPVMKQSFQKIVGEDLRKDAKKIAVPVLYVYGKEDRETPPKMGRMLQKATKGSRFLLIEGGHFAYLDDPVAFRLAAEEFFTDRSSIWHSLS